MILNKIKVNFENFNKTYNYFTCDIYATFEKILFLMYDKDFFTLYEYDDKSITASIYYVIDEISQFNNYNLNYFTELFGYQPLKYDEFYQGLCEYYNTDLEIIKEISESIKRIIRYDLFPDYFLHSREKVAIIGIGEKSKIF
ncbi:hypothetical protein Calow_0303 [Caldicellulosiruptor owensensis OL]|uniref:Uncharacterized protein n=2 Tax=Caldicellulosiruptor owensensis TaxID=55205 RepID=E4Q366_CALOW|nr:hypothetical protein Calow_0303 [Caldicellulosiruptor owensensis OL]